MFFRPLVVRGPWLKADSATPVVPVVAEKSSQV